MIPKMLQYQKLQPQGFSTTFQKWETQPRTYIGKLNSQDIIKFDLFTDGWIDPYNLYFEIRLKINNIDELGVVELDGTSQSLIEELAIYSNNVEIERIKNYDQITQVLNDLQVSQQAQINKQVEGSGFENINSNFSYTNNQQVQYNHVAEFTDFNLRELQRGYQPGLVCLGQWDNTLQDDKEDLGIGYSKLVGGTQNAIAEYILKQYYLGSSQYAIQSGLQGYSQDYAKISSIMDGELGIEHSQSLTVDKEEIKTAKYEFNTFQGCLYSDNKGFSVPYSSHLSNNKSQYFTKYNALKLINGKFIKDQSVFDKAQNKQRIINKMKLNIPVFSGVLGQLIPASEWKLLPGKAFKNLMIEVKLNPNAFFTAGPTGFNPTTVLFPDIQIESFKLISDIWFFDNQLTQYMDTQLQSGLDLSSQSWTSGPQFTLYPGQSVSNNYNVSTSIDSCKTLLFWFNSDDYLQYPFCRKHYRLSMNVGQIQLKLGSLYYPSQPIVGDASNIALNDEIKDDNSIFLIELYKIFFTNIAIQNEMRINKLNFAVNDRVYDPTITQYKVAQQYGQVAEFEYCGRQYSKTLFHERRCRGTAVFGFNLDANPFDTEILSGMDVSKIKPIEILIKDTQVDKSYRFQRQSTMYIMMNHDIMVNFKHGQVRVIGRGV